MTDIATVFLVDDDESVRTGLARLLRSAGYAVEAFASGVEFLARAPHDGNACLVLDLRMPGMSGSEVQLALPAHANRLPVIFLSGHGAVPDSVRAMKLGAVDFLTKPVDEDVLLAAIESAVTRHREQRSQDARLIDVRRRLASLTSRESEVLTCVISGALNKQIAAHLGIAEPTVKIHRARVLEKMGVASLAELVRLCETLGVPSRRCD